MMKLKLDVKALVIGIALGVVLAAVMGGTDRRARPETTLVGSADVSRFGMAIVAEGYGLVRTDEGTLYVVNPREGMAVRVLAARTTGVDPEDKRDPRGRSFNLSGLIQGGKEPEEY
jgi:hypothetical protein